MLYQNMARANTSERSSTHSALTRIGSTLKTDTVLTDKTERDRCAFGPIGGGVPQLLSNSSDMTFSYTHCCHCRRSRTFYRRIHNTFKVAKLIVQHNNAGPWASWYLERITLLNRAAMKYNRCNFHRWISSGHLSLERPCRIVPKFMA